MRLVKQAGLVCTVFDKNDFKLIVICLLQVSLILSPTMFRQ